MLFYQGQRLAKHLGTLAARSVQRLEARLFFAKEPAVEADPGWLLLRWG